MQSAILVVVLVFVGVLAALTINVTVRSGFDVLTALSLVVLVLIGMGVLGALLSGPPDE